MRKNCIKILLLCSIISFNVSGMDRLSLFVEFCKNPFEVGAIAPSSSYTGEELCSFISQDSVRPGLRILEIGGGYGNISEIIGGQMLEQDHLDVIEINPELCNKIEMRVSGCKNVTVQCCSILDWNPSERYDLIISTLPFNAFSYTLFAEIFAHIRTLGKKEVVFSYIEYLVIGKIRDFFSQNKEVKRIKEYLKKEWQKSVKIQKVWLNLPPLNVYHLRINE